MSTELYHFSAQPDKRGPFVDQSGMRCRITSHPKAGVPAALRDKLTYHADEAAFARAANLVPVSMGVPLEVQLWRVKAVAETLAHGDGNLLQAIESYLASMAGPEAVVARHAWQGVTIARYSRIVLAVADQLGISQDAMNGIFIQAKSLPT
jgi:hypothetical protein